MASKLKARKPEEVEPGKTKGVIFGPAGSGKTWFSLSFPSPYYIDTEGGASLKHYQERLKQSGGVYFGVEEGSLDFETVIQQTEALATEKHQYKTLVFDSITKLFQHRIAVESEYLGDKDVFGASKKPAIACMRRLVNWIDRIDMNVWFVAHEATEWGKNDKTGQREEIGKISDVWDKLIYEMHLGLQITRNGNVLPPTATVKKTRLIGFPCGESFKLTYEEFAKRYGKDFIEKESVPIIKATPEQVSEINRLCNLFKVSEDEKDKVLSKAKCDRWEDLDEEKAKKTIVWLSAKTKGE